MIKLRRFVLVGTLAGSASAVFGASTPLFENFGTLTNVPQLDAAAFANYGDFNVNTLVPYETQNTRYFTNTGRMIGNPGFRFETITANSVRSPAVSFFNGLDARIVANDAGRFLPGTVLTNFGLGFENSQVFISASNVVNKGQLLADTRGRVRIAGSKVDLTRSSVGILPFVGGQGFVTPTNFIPDVGISDRYWGMDDGSSPGPGGPPQLQPGSLAQPNRGSTNYTVGSPQHAVTNELNGFRTSLRLTNASAFTLTNAVTPSNWVVQSVFVQTSDTNIAFNVKFTPSSIATNPYRAAVVEFFKLETNVLDGGNFTNLIYLIDRVAAETNFILATNLTTQTTYRPANYEVTRATPFEYLSGQRPNVPGTNNVGAIIFSQTYSNALVTNIYSAYGFNVTNLAFTVPNVPGASLTNLPGRVELVGDELNLTRTRIRGEGIVTVHSGNVINTNSVIDVPNLSFDLKSASGNVLVRGLAKDMIERTTGDIFAWTGMWTNQTGTVTTNTVTNPSDPTQVTMEPVTNVIEIGFHALVVDATRVRVLQPVFTASFAARGTNVVIADTLRIRESILVEAENLTVGRTGQILLPSNIPDWNRSIFPTLRNFTNEGRITLSGTMAVGTQSPTDAPYVNVLNSGTISAFNQSFRAAYFENTGAIQSERGTFPPGVGTITVEAGSVKLENGRFEAGGDIRLAANDLKMQNYAITNRQTFTLAVTNSIGDAAPLTNNVISTEGFNFVVKPRVGDLLGTKIESIAPRFLAIPHAVVSEDRGPTAAGFKDNLALGRLLLRGDLESLFAFVPSGSGKRALYVDFLQLGPLVTNDIPNSILIDPNVVVYFADSNLPVDQLDGMFEGRLRWASEFAGPSSSVDVIKRSEKKTIKMNRALRASAKLDTDGDGIPNNLDNFPLDADTRGASTYKLTFEKRSSNVSISWIAQAGESYVVEYTTDLGSGSWQRLSTVTNSDQTAQPKIIEEPIPAAAGQRFYRVRPLR